MEYFLALCPLMILRFYSNLVNLKVLYDSELMTFNSLLITQRT
uniref:GHMP kinase family protein n=1 Tax=Arundo donax TaxID=35708 RepID=A0A0A9EMI3_ARUDO